MKKYTLLLIVAIASILIIPVQSGLAQSSGPNYSYITAVGANLGEARRSLLNTTQRQNLIIVSESSNKTASGIYTITAKVRHRFDR